MSLVLRSSHWACVFWWLSIKLKFPWSSVNLGSLRKKHLTQMQMSICNIILDCLDFFAAFSPILGFLKFYFCNTEKIFLSICVRLSLEKHTYNSPCLPNCADNFRGFRCVPESGNPRLRLSGLKWIMSLVTHLLTCFSVVRGLQDFSKYNRFFQELLCSFSSSSLQIWTLLIILLTSSKIGNLKTVKILAYSFAY